MASGSASGGPAPGTQTVVLVRSSSSARLPSYRRALAALDGLRLVVVHPEERPWAADVVQHWVLCETTDVDLVERALRAAMARHGFRPDAIVSFDEYGVYPAAVLAERMGLRAFPLPPAALQATNVKSLFREWCARHAIRAPRSVALRAPGALPRPDELRFPVVAKPSAGAGKMLVRKCDDMQQLVAHARVMWDKFASPHDAHKHTRVMGAPLHILVEEYIGGHEVDLDCLVEDGQVRFCAISDNFETHPPFFQETGGLTPSALPHKPQQALRSLLLDFVRSHGRALTGVLHFEAKWDSQRDAAYVIEVNCRMGSAETRDMVATAYGIDLGEGFIRLALGMPLFAIPRAPRCHAASVNIYPASQGVLRTQSIDQHDPSHVAHALSFKPGDIVTDPTFMIAWIVATAHTAHQAIEAVQRLTNNYTATLVIDKEEQENSISASLPPTRNGNAAL
jgi:biotin carboxylase